jgi:hypothetical protein
MLSLRKWLNDEEGLPIRTAALLALGKRKEPEERKRQFVL